MSNDTTTNTEGIVKAMTSKEWLIDRLLEFIRLTGTPTVIIAVFLWAGWQASIWLGNKIIMPMAEEHMRNLKVVSENQVELSKAQVELGKSSEQNGRLIKQLLEHNEKSDQEIISTLHKIADQQSVKAPQ